MDDWRHRVDVSTWQVAEVEQSGSHESAWLVPSDNFDDGHTHWLYKPTVKPQNGSEQGEDWSEVVSTQVASALGVPCARTRLCERHGVFGSISRSVRPINFDLHEGHLALEAANATGYFAHLEGAPGIDPSRVEIVRPGHTIDNIELALDGFLPPSEFTGPEGLTAFDVFAGYLVLDALIANRDRHENNWAVLVPQGDGEHLRLSASYDHASSLGFNLTDKKRDQLLNDRQQLVRWVERGTAYRFEHRRGHPRLLVDHAAEAIGRCTSAGADWWRERLGSVNLESVTSAVGNQTVDRLSDPAASLVVEILSLNLRRLKDAITN